MLIRTLKLSIDVLQLKLPLLCKIIMCCTWSGNEHCWAARLAIPHLSRSPSRSVGRSQQRMHKHTATLGTLMAIQVMWCQCLETGKTGPYADPPAQFQPQAPEPTSRGYSRYVAERREPLLPPTTRSCLLMILDDQSDGSHVTHAPPGRLATHASLDRI